MQELNTDDFADTALLPADSELTATPLQIVRSGTFDDFINGLTSSDQQWLKRQSLQVKPVRLPGWKMVKESSAAIAKTR